MRHSFVSVLSDNGVTLEQISRLVGRDGTGATEKVYRQQIRPVVERAATVVDGSFFEVDHSAWAVVSRSGNAKGRILVDPACLTRVGDTGFEPVTSSV